MKITATVGLITEEYQISELRTLAYRQVCSICHGNNGDMPCAYPGDNIRGCLKNSDNVERRRGALAFILSPDFDL